MKCKKCKTENAPVKKCCSECGSILEGYTINNFTGKYGYRNADGTFRVITDEPVIDEFFGITNDNPPSPLPRVVP